MDDLTPEQRKKNMQHIRSKNTESCIKTIEEAVFDVRMGMN